jgi:uncharacterized protein YPO0396
MIPISKEKYDAMLKKLDDMYSREEEIVKQFAILKREYEQIQDDKELLQTMIMHQVNKDDRKKKFYEG